VTTGRRRSEVRSARTRKAQVAEARELRRSDAALAAEARRLDEAFTRIRSLHRRDVPPALAPTALAGVVNERAIRAKHRKAALATIPRTDRARRAAAKAQAKAQAKPGDRRRPSPHGGREGRGPGPSRRQVGPAASHFPVKNRGGPGPGDP
jgi:hypothetical protein